MSFPAPDARLFRLVAKDLANLARFAAHGAGDAALRDETLRLRRLLLEDNYRRAFGQLFPGTEPTVLAPVLKPRDIATVDWGVATTPGAAEAPYPVPDLLVSLGIVFDGRGLSRGQIIKYVAHRLSGSRHDPDRDDKRGREFALPDEAVSGRAGALRAMQDELRTLGQCLVRSDDAQRWLDRARTVAELS